MAPNHPSQPPRPETLNGRGMFLTIRVVEEAPSWTPEGSIRIIQLSENCEGGVKYAKLLSSLLCENSHGQPHRRKHQGRV